MHWFPGIQGSLQEKKNFFLINSHLVSSSSLGLPFQSLWGLFWSLSLCGTKGLGFKTKSPVSLVCTMASCRVWGLKSLTHPLNGSVNASVNNITKFFSEISYTTTAFRWNSVINASTELVCLNYVKSMKWSSGSLPSNLSINPLVNSKYDVVRLWPKVTIPCYRHLWDSPSNCKVTKLIASESIIRLSLKYVSRFYTHV